jgi:hypothetical protein
MSTRLLGRRRTVSALALIVVTAALLARFAGVAAAAAPTWLAAQRIEPGQASISGVSCPSATTCLAASSSPIVQDAAPSYEPSTDPDPGSALNAVSCAPSTDFCMFIDGSGGAFTYSNGSFGTRVDVSGAIALEAVSCATSTFCVAVDHNNAVYKFSGTSWDAGTPLSAAGFTNNVNISCSSNAFCVETASTSSGEVYFKWNGNSWSNASTPFDNNDSHTVSLSCTAATFCLETGDSGYASVFNGTTWSVPTHVDSFNASPVLYSSCVGTSCVGLDRYDNFLQTSDGTTWSLPTNIHATTLISGIESLSCATATLCVAGDGGGDATTYAVAPATAAPSISGPATVGQTLTLTHAAVATSPVWYSDNWRRCGTQGSDCASDPISTSTSSYTLASADAGQYVDVLETVGFGFDEQGSLDSNSIGSVSSGSTGATGGNPAARHVKLVGSISTTRGGVVSISLSCSGGRAKAPSSSRPAA